LGETLRTTVLFTNKNKARQAAEELIEKADTSIDFNPDLVFFYATLKYNGHYQEMLDIFKKRFGNIPQIGSSVDGMIFPHDMRADGAVLVLCEDKDARIEVKSADKKSAVLSVEKLARQVKCEKGIVILHFPLIHLPSITKISEFWATGKYYSFMANRGDENTKRKMAKKLSEYCDEIKMFYLAPNVLDIFARQVHNKVPIVGVNVAHTQIKPNSPSIFSNFRDIGAGIAALVIEKDDIEVIYETIYPDKGSTMEETMDNVRNKFNVITQFNAVFERNVLISLDDKPPVKAFKDIIGSFEKDEEKLQEEINGGKLQVQVPYFLVLFNKKTNGFVITGIDTYYPFDLLPTFVDFSDFSDVVFLAHELIYSDSKDFISGLYSTKNIDSFNFFQIDVGTISAFGTKIFDAKMEVEARLEKNYLGIISASPSIFLPVQLKHKEYGIESKENIYFAAGGTNFSLSI
jgi:hypothetical protein